ncbi:MAG: hypothetical protein RJA44_260 [Pseudomonadota bacterium]
MWHPQTDNAGQPVRIHQPHQSTAPECWLQPQALATLAAGDAMPQAGLHGVPFAPWLDAPPTTPQWADVAGQLKLAESPLKLSSGKKAAAGAVIEEPDGRIWVVAPTNGFGGYTRTFPKGRVEPGLSLQASAIKEVWEEAGLRIEITALLGDFERSMTVTRYYRARRIGGTPAAMGWESQSVSLVPLQQLPALLTNPNDAPILKLLGAAS